MYNFLNDYTFIDNTPVVEGVTVAEAKLYCRVTTVSEDDLFAELITQARESIEKVTNLSLIPRQVNTWFDNQAGGYELPFGPVTFFMALFDEQGDEIATENYVLVGDQYPKVRRPLFTNMSAQYMAGFNCLPKDLKIAILDQVSFDYENRGLDGDKGICEKTWKACQRWTRQSPIL